MAVHVHVDDLRVDIHLTGWDATWAMRSRLVVPIHDIEAARVAPVGEMTADLSWRLGGTALPRVVTAGNYAVKGRPGFRQFWSVYRDAEALVIDTHLRKPARVVIQHRDRHDLAWWIGERLESA